MRAFHPADPLGGLDVQRGGHDIGIVDRRDLVGRDVDVLRVRGGLDLDPPRFTLGQRALRRGTFHRPRGERVVRHELCMRLPRDAHRATEMVRV